MSDSHDQSPLEPRKSIPGASGLEVQEDASSQALSDALRSSFGILKFVMFLLVGVFLFSGFRQVGTQEKAIILRLGRPAGGEDKPLLGPGLHWAFPYPIDEMIKIPMGQIQTVSSTIGWYATTAAAEAAHNEPPAGPSLNPAIDGYVLTGDGNIIHVRGTMLYRITEPAIRYEFDFVDASNVVQNIFNNALNYAAANYPVDDALTRDVAGFREKVRSRVEKLATQYKLGITIDQVSLQAIPPRQLAQAFAAVGEAGTRSSTARIEALGYENQTLSRAKSEAAARINAGETDRNRLVEFVAAEARRFTDLLPAYQSNPALFVQQRQMETMQKVLKNAKEKWGLLPEQAGGKPGEVRLQLNREQQKIKALVPAGEDNH